MRLILLFTTFAAAAVAAAVATATLPPRTVLVTGASGRTGSIIYALLKHRAAASSGIEVRALVHNATKARDIFLPTT